MLRHVARTALAIALLSGCGGGGSGQNANLPAVTTPPPVVVPTSGPGGQTTFKIIVPSASSASSTRAAKRVNAQTPVVQSLTMSIASAATRQVVHNQTIDVTSSSPGCSAAQAQTVCVVTVTLQAGSYVATIATYSATAASGTRLSAGQQVAFGVEQGGSNQVGLTLGGLPAAFRLTPLSSSVGGSQSSGFTLTGIYSLPRAFNIVAVDASHNVVVGPQAPTFAMASTSGSFSIGQPAPAAPNVFSVTPAGTQNATAQLSASATLPAPASCSQTGVTCSAKVSLTFAPYAGDDWITFARNFQRTAQQTQTTGISASTVSGLKQRWTTQVVGGIYASPLVWNGNVIVSTASGFVYDLSAATGATLWSSAKLHYTGTGTPTLDPDDGLILVGAHPAGSYPSELYALRLSNGSVAWHEQLPGSIRAQAVYANGRFYEGWGGGDHPACLNGGVTALDAKSGAREWTWITNTTTNPGGGGGVWGALAYDGKNLYFGTGNTCSPTPDMQGAVAVSLSGVTVWQYIADPDINDDGDTGGGVMLQNGTATFINKNGSYYNLNAATGAKNWATPLGAGDGAGGFASPGTDGSMTVIGAGEFAATAASYAPSARSADLDRLFCIPHGAKPNDVVSGFTSRLVGVTSTGAVQWKIPMQSRIVNYVAVNDGLAFVGLDTNMDALDINTGSVIWSFANPVGTLFDAGPVVVPSGLYIADERGNVYAFSLPVPASASPATRSK